MLIKVYVDDSLRLQRGIPGGINKPDVNFYKSVDTSSFKTGISVSVSDISVPKTQLQVSLKCQAFGLQSSAELQNLCGSLNPPPLYGRSEPKKADDQLQNVSPRIIPTADRLSQHPLLEYLVCDYSAIYTKGWHYKSPLTLTLAFWDIYSLAKLYCLPLSIIFMRIISKIYGLADKIFSFTFFVRFFHSKLH